MDQSLFHKLPLEILAEIIVKFEQKNDNEKESEIEKEIFFAFIKAYPLLQLNELLWERVIFLLNGNHEFCGTNFITYTNILYLSKISCFMTIVKNSKSSTYRSCSRNLNEITLNIAKQLYDDVRNYSIGNYACKEDVSYLTYPLYTYLWNNGYNRQEMEQLKNKYISKCKDIKYITFSNARDGKIVKCENFLIIDKTKFIKTIAKYFENFLSMNSSFLFSLGGGCNGDIMLEQ